MKGITAIRLEALPDDRLPNRGPGRVYYEGPFGDFFLSEIRLSADGKTVPLKEATASNPKAEGRRRRRSTATRRRAGRSMAGKGTSSRRSFASPLRSSDAGEITVEMVFERYYAAGLGRFRISATTDQRPSRRGRFPSSSSRSC